MEGAGSLEGVRGQTVKHIHLLEDVVLTDRLTKEPWRGQDGRQTSPITMTHKMFLLGRLCDLLFGRGSENIRASLKLEKAIDDGVVYVSCEDSDYALLWQTIKTPHPDSPFIPNIVPCLYPFMEAVENAPSEVPKEWKEQREELLEADKDEEDGTESDDKSGPETAPSS